MLISPVLSTIIQSWCTLSVDATLPQFWERFIRHRRRCGKNKLSKLGQIWSIAASPWWGKLPISKAVAGAEKKAACTQQLHYSFMQIRMDKKDIRREILYGGTDEAACCQEFIVTGSVLSSEQRNNSKLTAPSLVKQTSPASLQAGWQLGTTDWLTDCCSQPHRFDTRCEANRDPLRVRDVHCLTVSSFHTCEANQSLKRLRLRHCSLLRMHSVWINIYDSSLVWPCHRLLKEIFGRHLFCLNRQA